MATEIGNAGSVKTGLLRLLAGLVLFGAVAVGQQPKPLRAPTDDQIDDTVTLEELVEPGDDSMRWTRQTGAEIEGFVIDIHPPLPAGACPAPRADAETVIELTTDPNIFDPAHRFSAIVTTAWRQRMAAAGKDWRKGVLQARYLRRSVRIRGWLEFARDQAPCAVNTADFGAAATRATAWQIRPVTAIALSDPDAPGAIP
jgi:hypothetical protein